LGPKTRNHKFLNLKLDISAMDLYKKYKKQIIPAMKERFKYTNDLAVPKIEKIVVNIGLNRGITEKDPKYIEMAAKTISEITGQRPIENLAKKSIAGFKIRTSNTVGLSTILRSAKMYDFLEKLINITLPRVRDFRGISLKSIDQKGNLSIGFKEQIVFPEMDPEKIQRIHGLQVVITTTAKNREEGIELFKLFGIPLRK